MDAKIKNAEQFAINWVLECGENKDILDAITALAKQAWLAGHYAMGANWIDIKKHLPPFHEQILVYGRSKKTSKINVYVAKLYNNWAFQQNPFKPQYVWEGVDIVDFGGKLDEILDVSHWMPFPEKPNS